MLPKILSAEYVSNYVIRLRFADGTEGDLDLAQELWGEVFEPLKNLDLFRQFRLNQELNTLVWPTGADLAPEYLYERIATCRMERRPEKKQ